MKKQIVSSLAAVVLLGFWGAVLAHHGTATSYDKNRLIKVQGVVKEFRWRNPHSGLFLVGKDESGKEVIYSLEMGSPAVLARLGFSRKTFKPGDAVVAEVYPSYGSKTSGELFSRQVWVNGKPVVTGDPGKAEEEY